MYKVNHCFALIVWNISVYCHLTCWSYCIAPTAFLVSVVVTYRVNVSKKILIREVLIEFEKFSETIRIFPLSLPNNVYVYVTYLFSRACVYCLRCPRIIPYFQNKITLFSVKIFKTICCFGKCSIINALNLEKLVVRIHNCPFLFCYNVNIALFSIISPNQGFPWYNHRKTCWTQFEYYKV